MKLVGVFCHSSEQIKNLMKLVGVFNHSSEQIKNKCHISLQVDDGLILGFFGRLMICIEWVTISHKW